MLSQMTAPPPLTTRKDGLLSLRQSGHWRAPDGKHRVIFCMVASPSHELDRLISENGPRIVHAVDREGTPILWNAVERGRPDCANVLLDHAKSNGVSVPFKCTGDRYDDLLSRAIDNRSDAHVEFVLDRLTGGYATVAETIELLAEHLSKFFEQFPKITKRFLNEDRFAIEYARFDAPKYLFGKNGETPVAMLTNDHSLQSWHAMDCRAAKEFWIECSQYGKELSDTEGQQISVVAKLSCIHPMAWFEVYKIKYVRICVRLTELNHLPRAVRPIIQ